MTATYDQIYTEPAPKAGAPRVGRRQEIELLRILSAFGIVWCHMVVVGRDIGYAGLIVFTIISMYFGTSSRTPRKSLAHRARTLLVPWLIWFVFYGCLNLASGKPFLSQEHGLLSGVLLGTSVHLWYIPFIFFATVLFDRVKQPIGEPALAYGSYALALGLLISCNLWRGPSLALNYPYAQYIHALAAVFVGVFFANGSAMSRIQQAGLIAVLLLTITWFALPMHGLGVPYFLGVSLAAVTLLVNWELPSSLNVSWLSECTLGIYLSHIFWMKLLYKLAPMPTMALPCAVFAISALTVWGFRKTLPKAARYIV